MAGDSVTTVPEDIADKEIQDLKSATKTGLWYKLNVVGMEEISPRLGHSFIPEGVKLPKDDNPDLPECTGDVRVSLIGGGNHEGATAEVWELRLSSTDPSLPDTVKSVAVTKLSPIEGLSPKYEFLCSKIASKTWLFGGADAQLTFNAVGYIEDGMWVESLSNSASTVPSPRTQGSNSAVVGEIIRV